MIDGAQSNQQAFEHAETICQENAYPSTRASQARAQAGHRGRPSPYSTRTTSTFPRERNAAIENWRMLQPGRPTRTTAIVELIADRLAATTAILKGEPDQTVHTTQDSPTDTPAAPTT
jgi:hypothetical protein